MNSSARILLLLFVSLIFPPLISPSVPAAGAALGPADYPITVHVRSSQLNGSGLELNVIIAGTKYCLSGVYGGVLSPGDY